MKSSLFVFLFMTACGPAFHSDLFGGEQDAAAILETGTPTLVSVPDSANKTTAGDASAGDSALSSDAPQGLEVEACSCTELCSGAYPLRACQSCYEETCPTWEGGLPQ